MALEVRMAANELAEAEAVIILADQPAHAVHALDKPGTTFAKLSGRGVALIEPLDNRVGRQGPGFQGQQNPRRIQRIEKPESVANQDPTVSSHLAGAVGIFLGRPEF